MLGCGGTNYWNSAAAGDAYTDYTSYRAGVGTSAYYFGGGPGMDPDFNGTSSEAYAWGRRQAEIAVSMASSHSFFDTGILILDVEDDYPAGVATGWNEVLVPGSCSRVKSAGISPSLDRATFNGFWDYVWNNSRYFIAVYSSRHEWSGIFGTGGGSSLTNTIEWTANYGGDCVNPGPYGWTQGAGSCPANSAGFFGGISSSSRCAFAWQWAGVGSGDYDQIDANNKHVCK